MKNILRSIRAGFLTLIARDIITKYHPTIVMVTGSVGKTSTKDAVAAALGGTTYLRASEKSYNSELGVPLTIIGAHSAWGSLIGWIRIVREGVALIFLKSHYPKMLVLEVGADRPGDLAKILSIVTPDAVVVTRLPEVPVHVEAYATPRAVREEEFLPAYALPSGAPLILSSRDTYAIDMAKNTQANVTLFGFSQEADVHIEEPILVMKEGKPFGMEAKATVGGASYILRAPGVLGRPQILAPAAALSVALSLGVSAKDALRGLESYVAPSGRGQILRGKKGSILVDESYNASPAAVEEALGALSLLSGSKRRIAVLGDMLELGRYSKEEHERIAQLAAQQADMLVAVGPRAKAMHASATLGGLSEENVQCFETATEATAFLIQEVHEGDVVLVKGSQSMRMERILEALLLNPEDARLLVRQEPEWKRR